MLNAARRMPAKDLEKRREASRRYRSRHPERVKRERRESMRKWYATHREEARGRAEKWKSENPEKVREYKRAWKKRNPENVKQHTRKNRIAHIAERRLYLKNWYSLNKDRARERQRIYGREHQAERIIRNAVHHMFRFSETGKHCRAVQYVGCSPAFLRMHLEKQFRPGMTWENYGAVWHVDHIVPVSKWNLRDGPENLFRASHYSNLQPLFSGENLRKGNRA